MRRLHAKALRIALTGFAALSFGIAIVIASLVQGSGAPAFADSSPYELYCPGTPVGNIVLNGVVTTGIITPASPAVGQQFNLTNYQSVVALPSSIVSAAAALGNSAITGTANLKVDATGATPASVAAPPITIDAPIPSPVPTTGLALNLPSTPGTVGPFTASGGAITVTVDPAISLGLVVSGSTLNLTCTPYPNNSETTGIVASAPTAAKASPVIATATAGTGTTTTSSGSTSSTPTTTPSTALTGAYELYCPSTPVGNVVLNDAVTSATLSPTAPATGQSFSITGYQTMVNLPESLASAAASLQPNLEGSATAQIDASGAVPATTPQGPLDFNVPIPSPVPADGVTLSLPSTAATVSGFTATSNQVTIQEDSAASLTLTVSGAPLSLTCTAYPNDTITPSGITTTTPSASPIAPVIAVGSGGSTTTTVAPVTTTTGPSATTTTASITTTTGSGSSTTLASATTTTSASTTTMASSTTTTSAVTASTKPPNTSGTSGTTSPPSRTVTAPSGSLAFTGSGPGLKTMTLIGAGVALLGLVLLVLVDIPRRVLRQLAYVSPARWKHRASGGARTMANAVGREAAHRITWLLGR